MTNPFSQTRTVAAPSQRSEFGWLAIMTKLGSCFGNGAASGARVSQSVAPILFTRAAKRRGSGVTLINYPRFPKLQNDLLLEARELGATLMPAIGAAILFN